MDFDQIEKILEIDCKVIKGRPILAGVSGGPDSLCLLYILNELGYSVIAGHVNHHLRAEADEEASKVQQICSSRNIPLFIYDVDVVTFSREQKISIEESARILRYQKLMEAAKEISAQALAVAHQADDQIETMLMHLLRGSGMSGLKAMSYRSINSAFSLDIPIIRPLLGVWRKEIEDYCESRKITPSYDQSNNDQTYFRNRIRHELVPLLNTYNIQASQHLWQLSQLVGSEDALLDQYSCDLLKQVVLDQGQGYFVLSKENLLITEIALQRRIIRSLLGSLNINLRDIGFNPVENVIRFLSEPEVCGEWQILENTRISRFDRKKVLLFTDCADLCSIWPLIEKEVTLETPFPGRIPLNPHWYLEVEIIEKELVVIEQNDLSAYFDMDQLSSLLKICTWTKGETISPYGMGGRSIKIGDFFTNNHVPLRARDRWPILKMNGEVLWIIGMRRSEIAPINQLTHKVVKFSLVKAEKAIA
jgi:tRNA(Ile)-lysidine synthase